MCRFVIDLKAILENFNRVKKRLNSGVKICSVVKANAYGFGAEKISKLLEHQTDYFAVARLCEFLRLRKNGIKTPILILSPLLEKEMKIAVKNCAEITVVNCEMLKKVVNFSQENNVTAKVHLKIDTGMNRFGFKDVKEFKEALKIIKKTKFVDLVGVYSHFYDASDEIVEKQLETFEKYKKITLKAKFRPIFHIASSSLLADKRHQFDMVRLGIDLYLSEYHSFESEILQVKNIDSGEAVSYGGTFVAPYDMKIAICCGGYADGISRKLSNCGEVIVEGKIAKIIGRICMDCFMIDITNTDAKVGDTVLVFGKMNEKYISVCDIATKCDTIPYEIYTGISSRVKRVYHWRHYAGYFREISGKKTYKS